MLSRAHSGSHDQTSHCNLIGWSHMTAESAQPRKRSNVTRPFPFPRAGSGYETILYLALLRLLTAPALRNGRLDFHHVTVSCAMAPERSSARSSVVLRDRPGMQGPENPRRLRPATGRYRTRSFRGFILCSF